MTDAPAIWPADPRRPAEGPQDGAGSLPLSGVRILDLSRILAGPFATMLLADMGADVIKVESPGHGDETRHWGPPFSADGTATYYLAVNRNKRSITLDLTDIRASALAGRLARAADVLIDNFLPGRLSRFGLDPNELRKHNPGLISATISGFGSGNAYSGRPGFDFLAQAMGGMMAVTGQPGGEPTRVGVAISDLAAGLFVNHGILAALHERDRTGVGRHVEVSLLDAQVALLVNLASGWLNGGVATPLFGNAHPNIAPYETVATSDGELALAVGTDRQFARLAEAIGDSELARDPRFVTNRGRVDHRLELRQRLHARFVTGSRAHWMAVLDEAAVPVAPVNSLPEVFEDPVVDERLVTGIEGVVQLRSPVRFDAAPLEPTSAPPALGQDTDAILQAMGLSNAEISQWRETGAC